jgi:hypothetical protein
LSLPATTGEPYLEFYLIGLAERPELNEPQRVHLSESLLDPNTRGWVLFTHTHHTDSHNKNDHSNSFDTEEHSHRKGKEKEKRGGRIVKSFLIFLVEKTDWMDTKWEKWG